MPKTPAELKLVEKKIGEFFAEKKAAELYPAKKVDALKAEMVASCADKSEDQITDFLESVGEIFAERREAARHYKNVRRQESEIRKFELNPGKVDVSDLAAQMIDLTPVGRYGDSGWVESRGYRESIGNNAGSIIGGTKAEVRNIMERDKPIIHTEMPSKFYRNNVFDANVTALDEIRVNDERLRVLLSEDRALTQEDVQKVVKRSRPGHVVSNLTEAALSLGVKVTNWAGKGLLSHSKASEDDRYKKYLKFRNELLSMAMWISAGAKDSSSYLKMLDAVNQTLEFSGDVMDQATFAKMQQLITDEMAKSKEKNEKETQVFNDEIQKLNKEMLDGMQGFVTAEDDMWKYRIGQVILLLTPLGGLSLFGHVFNYMDPISQLLGPAFGPNMSFGDGIASMATSPVLGPLGKMADALGVDEIIKGIFQIPGIHQLGEVVDVLKSGIGQNVVNIAGNVAASPLIPIGIAGVVSLMRADTEVQHYSKVSAFREKKTQALEDAFDNFKKKRTGEPLKAEIAGFINKKFGVLREANFESVMLNFVGNLSAEELAIFDGLKFKKGTEETKLSDLKKEGKLDPNILQNLLSSNAALKTAFEQKFLVLNAVHDDKKTPAENVAAFNAKAFEAPKIAADRRQEIYGEYVIHLAKEARLTTIEKDPNKQLADFAKQLVELETQHVYDMEKYATPSPSVRNPIAKPAKLHGRSPVFTPGAA